MTFPTEPVTLNVEQIEELNRKLSAMRHDVNGKLSLITLALGAFQLQPQNGERWLNIMAEQPQKIVADIAQFSREMEAALQITRP
jgi:ribosome maturation factor RimP